MKKYVSAILILCMIALGGCGTKADTPEEMVQNSVGAENMDKSDAAQTAAEKTAGTAVGSGNADGLVKEEPVSGTGKPVDVSEEGIPGMQQGTTARFEIIDVDKDQLLVSGVDEMKGLYSVAHGTMLEGRNGQSIGVSDLKTGMIVDLTWEGFVLESYPGQFSYRQLKVTDEAGSSELEFYKELIRELAEVDPGLNDDIIQSFFDFTKVNSLSDEEKEGLAYMGGTYFGAMGDLATEEELSEQGILDPVKGIEKGVLVTIEEISSEENQIKCNARKFRSGTGAYYFNDVTAHCKGGKWTYTIGGHMIS